MTPATWEVRLIGAVAGVVAGGLVGLLLAIAGTGDFGISFGMVASLGAGITGAAYAPGLAYLRSPDSAVFRATFVACAICVAFLISTMVVAVTLRASGGLLGLSLGDMAWAVTCFVFGYPLAVVVALFATAWGKQAVTHADESWKPAVVVVLLMVTLAGIHFARLMGGIGPPY